MEVLIHDGPARWIQGVESNIMQQTEENSGPRLTNLESGAPETNITWFSSDIRSITHGKERD